jgi:hypothetical protein
VSTAAQRAWATRRAARAVAAGLSGDAQPVDRFEVDDDSFDVCAECGVLQGTVHVCASLVQQARTAALNIITPAVRTWAVGFVEYLCGVREYPLVPVYLAAECRAFELRAAELGLADPRGFVVGADLLRLRMKPGHRKGKRAEVPEELAKYLPARRR